MVWVEKMKSICRIKDICNENELLLCTNIDIYDQEVVTEQIFGFLITQRLKVGQFSQDDFISDREYYTNRRKILDALQMMKTKQFYDCTTFFNKFVYIHPRVFDIEYVYNNIQDDDLFFVYKLRNESPFKRFMSKKKFVLRPRYLLNDYRIPKYYYFVVTALVIRESLLNLLANINNEYIQKKANNLRYYFETKIDNKDSMEDKIKELLSLDLSNYFRDLPNKNTIMR